MAKETNYFSHDYNARNDEKIKALIRKHGMEGYGVFWAIVEELYNNSNILKLDTEGLAYDLRVDNKLITSVIESFGLFIIREGNFGSASIEARLEIRI